MVCSRQSWLGATKKKVPDLFPESGSLFDDDPFFNSHFSVYL